jgi:hypothetical protein
MEPRSVGGAAWALSTIYNALDGAHIDRWVREVLL